MATIKINGQSYLLLDYKITTPSIKIANAIYKNINIINSSSSNAVTSTNTYVPGYIPLFSGSKGSVVNNGVYNYTLGGLKVGNYYAAISRVLANNAPEIQLVSAIKNVEYSDNTALCTITVKVRDKDNNSLSMYIRGAYPDPTSGSYLNYSWKTISSSAKTITSTSDWQEVSFTVILDKLGGYSGVNYLYEVCASDGKTTTTYQGRNPS